MRAKSMTSLLVLPASLIAVGHPAYAFDINGAWATDTAVCDKVFVKKDNKVSFARNSAEYGGGFIIEGNRLRGQLQSCSIKSRKEDASSIHMLAACSTDIMMSSVQLSARVVDDNTILRYFPGMSDDLAMRFARCPK